MLLIKIVNDGSRNRLSGNYDYTVFINERQIASGRIEEHRRLNGWEELVGLLAKNVSEEGKQ